MSKQEHSHRYFTNRDCDYYPCHGLEGQNCLFCFCPLYWLPVDCGGDWKLTDSGVKDCSGCLKPHDTGGYEFVLGKLRETFGRLDDFEDCLPWRPKRDFGESASGEER